MDSHLYKLYHLHQVMVRKTIVLIEFVLILLVKLQTDIKENGVTAKCMNTVCLFLVVYAYTVKSD